MMQNMTFVEYNLGPALALMNSSFLFILLKLSFTLYRWFQRLSAFVTQTFKESIKIARNI